jgi:hypothetical protein
MARPLRIQYAGARYYVMSVAKRFSTVARIEWGFCDRILKNIRDAFRSQGFDIDVI